MSPFSILAHWEYYYRNNKYEWHIETSRKEIENKPFFRFGAHWKYDPERTLLFLKSSCCHLFELYEDFEFCQKQTHVFQNYYHFIDHKGFPKLKQFKTFEGYYSFPWQNCDNCTKSKLIYEREKMKKRENYEYRKRICEMTIESGTIFNPFLSQQ